MSTEYTVPTHAHSSGVASVSLSELRILVGLTNLITFQWFSNLTLKHNLKYKHFNKVAMYVNENR